MPRTQILLVEDDVLLRETLGRLLESEADLAVRGWCGTPAEALEALREAPVDLGLIEANTAPNLAHEFVIGARAAGYGGKFLLMTSTPTLRGSVKALQLGVSGIFLKSRGLEKLLHSIRIVASGETWVDRDIIQVLAQGVGEVLSDREREVLQGVLDGLTNRAMAERMGVPEATVNAALRRIFRRSGLRGRAQLIRAAMDGSLGVQ